MQCAFLVCSLLWLDLTHIQPSISAKSASRLFTRPIHTTAKVCTFTITIYTKVNVLLTEISCVHSGNPVHLAASGPQRFLKDWLSENKVLN